MKITLFFLFFILRLQPFNAQEIKRQAANRFLYELTYKIDSTDAKNIKKENFYLDVYDKKSRFASEGELIKDSTIYDVQKTGNAMNAFAMIGKVKPKFKYYVIKNFETEKVLFYDVGIKSLHYEENLPKIPWNIQSETKTFGNITCQKATATLYGRNWTAWFSNEIAINDGPYKFGGLPGIIINIYDEKQDYNFLMVKNTKDEILTNLETLKNPIKFASKEKFLKAKRGYDENPLQSADAIGLQLTEEMKRDVMIRVKSRLKTENNPLELKP